MAARSNSFRAVTFRPDQATLRALEHLESALKGRDRSQIIRESIKSYERQVLMDRIVAACGRHGEESERVANEFDAADDGLPD